MIRFNQVSLALATVAILSSGVAQAGLVSRANGTMLYDEVLNITWLADANYAQTSGHDADGRMNWTDANLWADNLVYGGYDDWRLPTALNEDGSGPCEGFFCTNSEWGHMFFSNMGASVGGDILSGANVDNLALIANLQSFAYWSGTTYAPNPADYAWSFSTNNGYQYGGFLQLNEFYAWAVRPGDVAAPIPEPETYALFLAGLGLLGVVARRRKQKTAA